MKFIRVSIKKKHIVRNKFFKENKFYGRIVFLHFIKYCFGLPSVTSSSETRYNLLLFYLKKVVNFDMKIANKTISKFGTFF